MWRVGQLLEGLGVHNIPGETRLHMCAPIGGNTNLNSYPPMFTQQTESKMYTCVEVLRGGQELVLSVY